MSKCVIVLSHSNYRKTFAGTEKFISEIQRLYNGAGIHVLHAFPVKAINKSLKKYLGFKGNYLGMHLDGKYIGLYLQEKLPEALRYLQDKLSLTYLGVSINHLLLWDMDVLADSLLAIKLPVNIVVHDYYMVCPFINNEGRELIANDRIIHAPDSGNCAGCTYLAMGEKHINSICNFFDKIDHLVERVVFPSNNIKETWCGIFDRFKMRAIVRPHLVFSVLRQSKTVDSGLRIAYLGNTITIKGIEEWRRLTKEARIGSIRYYYLGSALNENVGTDVTKVYVGMKDGKLIPMTRELKKNSINVAFLWSKCQETYCYTLFEALEAGCFIVTLKGSGNIEDYVRDHKCGIIYESIDRLIDSVLDNSFERMVREYFEDYYTISDVSANSDLDSLMFIGREKSIPKDIKALGPNRLLSKIYELAAVKY